jgi:hypothetical protein
MVPDIEVTGETIDAILADPDFRPGFGVLSDWRLGLILATDAYIEGFLDLLKAAEQRGVRKWATVVDPSSLAAYGVGRKAETQSELQGLTYRVFRDYDQALAWLTDDR